MKKRTKLLLYIYKRGLPDDFNKTQLAKKLGYKSPGHFHRDFEKLINEELIEHDPEKGVYRITDKGLKEIGAYALGETTAMIFAGIGSALLLYYAGTILGIKVEPEVYAILGLMLLLMGVGLYLLLRRTYKQIGI